MKLRNIVEVYQNEISIRQGTKIGVSGSYPVASYNSANHIPDVLLDREVESFQCCPVERYGRPSALLQVQLKGYVEYEEKELARKW